jgi:hypothetical protein
MQKQEHIPSIWPFLSVRTTKMQATDRNGYQHRLQDRQNNRWEVCRIAALF